MFRTFPNNWCETEPGQFFLPKFEKSFGQKSLFFIHFFVQSLNDNFDLVSKISQHVRNFKMS